MAHVINAKAHFLIRRHPNLSLLLRIVIALALKFSKPSAQKKLAPPVVYKRLKSGRQVISTGNHYILSASGVYCS